MRSNRSATSPRESFIQTFATRSLKSIVPSASWSTIPLASSRMESKGLRDLLVALPDFHRLGLPPDDVVEDRGLGEGAGDDGDAVLVEIGNALEESVDRGVLGPLRHQAEIPQGGGRPVEILHGRPHDHVSHECLLDLDMRHRSAPGPRPPGVTTTAKALKSFLRRAARRSRWPAPCLTFGARGAISRRFTPGAAAST